MPESLAPGGPEGENTFYTMRSRHPSKSVALALTALAMAATLPVSARAAGTTDWPQWRGPFLNGSSPDRGLPVTWSRTRNVAWVAPLPGPAGATPAVWGERVFVSSTDADAGATVAICVDRTDGKVLWQKRIGTARKLRRGNTSAAPSPVTDGRRVVFMYGTGELVAVDFGGRVIWRRDLAKEFGDFLIKYGYGGSPLLYDGRLYVSVLQNDKPHPGQKTGPASPKGAYTLAVDVRTGKTIWQRTRPTEAREESKEAYTTPVALERAGRAGILVLGGDCLTCLEPETGRELWRWDGYNPKRKNRSRLIPSPVVPTEGRSGLVYLVAPRGEAVFAVRPPQRRVGGPGSPQVAWRYRGRLPDVPTPALYGGRLYVLSGRNKVMTCLDPLTGEKKWEGKLGGKAVYYASPTAADGKIYCIDTEGNVVVLAAGDSFRELSRVSMGEGPCHSTIVAAGGELFIRTARNLYCIRK